MTDTPPLLTSLLTNNHTIADAAPDTLRTIATDNPAHAPDIIKALQALINSPVDGRSAKRHDGSVFAESTDATVTADTSAILPSVATDTHRETGLWALGTLATQYSDEIADVYELIVDLCTAERARTREYALYAAGCIAATGSVDERRCIDDAIIPALENGTTGDRTAAAWAASHIATATPDTVVPAVSSLKSVLVHPYDGLRLNALEAIALIADSDLDHVTPSTLDISNAITNDDHAPVCTWALAHATQHATLTSNPITANTITTVLDGHGLLAPIAHGLSALATNTDPAYRLAAATALTYLYPLNRAPNTTVTQTLTDLAEDAEETVATVTRNLLHTGSWHSEWELTSHEVAPARHTVQFRVTPSTRLDSGRNRAYPGHHVELLADSDYNQTNSFSSAVHIAGEKGSTIAQLRPPKKRVTGLELNPQLMQYLGVATGDTVTVQPAQPVIAHEVTVRPPIGVELVYTASFSDAVKLHLRETPVAAGSLVPIPVITEPNRMVRETGRLTCDASIPLAIESTTPPEHVLITDRTSITVAADNPAAVGDWWGTAEKHRGTCIEPRQLTSFEIGPYLPR